MSEKWICGLEIQETYSSSSVANVLDIGEEGGEIMLGKKAERISVQAAELTIKKLPILTAQSMAKDERLFAA